MTTRKKKNMFVEFFENQITRTKQNETAALARSHLVGDYRNN